MIGAALLSLFLSSAQLADPAAPRQAGRLLCHMPDEALKTCQALASFQPLGDGRFMDLTQTRMNFDDRSVTYSIRTEMVLKDGAMCYLLRPAQLNTIQLKVTGRPLGAAMQQALRREIVAGVAAYVGKETCATLSETPEGLAMRSTVNGTHDPNGDQYVKWVAPAEGYRLGS